MTPVSGSTWMTVTQAQYITRVTPFVASGTGWNRALPADPRRWRLYVYQLGLAGGTLAVGPPGITSVATGQATAPNPLEVKFNDCPSMCTGAWYVSASPAFTTIFIEELYVGG